jgi:hypothetical protein
MIAFAKMIAAAASTAALPAENFTSTKATTVITGRISSISYRNKHRNNERCK